MNLMEYQEVIDWTTKKNLAESTEKTYINILLSYCEYIGKNPTELIEEAEEDEIDGLRPRRRRVSSYFFSYFRKIKEDRKAPKTVSLYMNALRSFYDANDIQVPKITLPADNSLEQNKGKLLSKEEIRRMVDVAGLRERAMIYTMALSGMSQNEARNLTIKKFMEALSVEISKRIRTVENLLDINEEDIKDVVITLEVIRQKTHYRYITFLPPEAINQILSYLRERSFGLNEKIRIQSINEPIFVKNNGEKLSRDSVVTNFRRIGIEAGFEKEHGAYSYWRSHSFRKYFISTIKNSIGDYVIADFMAGHKLSNVDDVYWYRDSRQLKQRYLKALPYLSIDEAKVKDVKSEEYKEIKQENEMLKEQIKKQEEQHQVEMAKLDERVESIEKENEIRIVNMGSLKDTFNLISTIADSMVPKDAENRIELVLDKVDELTDKFWDTLPLAEQQDGEEDGDSEES